MFMTKMTSIRKYTLECFRVSVLYMDEDMVYIQCEAEKTESNL